MFHRETCPEKRTKQTNRVLGKGDKSSDTVEKKFKTCLKMQKQEKNETLVKAEGPSVSPSFKNHFFFK